MAVTPRKIDPYAGPSMAPSEMAKAWDEFYGYDYEDEAPVIEDDEDE